MRNYWLQPILIEKWCFWNISKALVANLKFAENSVKFLQFSNNFSSFPLPLHPHSRYRFWFPLEPPKPFHLVSTRPKLSIISFSFFIQKFFQLATFYCRTKKTKKILKILWKIQTRSCFRWKTTLLLILFANFFKDCISRHCVKSTTVENLFILYLNLFKNKTAGGVGGKLGEKRNRKSSFNFRSENSTKMRGKTHKWISDSFNLQWNSVKPDNKKNDGRATSLQVNLARRIETS